MPRASGPVAEQPSAASGQRPAAPPGPAPCSAEHWPHLATKLLGCRCLVLHGEPPAEASRLITLVAVKKVSESFNVQFRAEFFNVFNHANFAPPLPFNGSGNAQIFKANGSSANAGGLQSLVTLPRDIQFALKIMW